MITATENDQRKERPQGEREEEGPREEEGSGQEEGHQKESTRQSQQVSPGHHIQERAWQARGTLYAIRARHLRGGGLPDGECERQQRRPDRVGQLQRRAVWGFIDDPLRGDARAD